MEGIRVISTSTIQASSHANGDFMQKIHLTPWDLIFLQIEVIQQGLLFHKPKAKDTSIQIQHLKHTLSSTLAFFPPLTGRLIVIKHEGNTASSFIQCNNEGAHFVHAIAENTTVSDILQPNYVPSIVQAFFPLNGVKNYQGTSQPLLAVQVTELVDGIFIGCTINHVAVDGKSFWHFINSWAEISRGLDKVTKFPKLERWFLDGIDHPIRFPFKQHPQYFHQHPPPLERIFQFSKEKIAQLKSKANAEVSTDKISSLQALLTHLWRSVIRSQRLDSQQETHLRLVIDVRSRMCSKLPAYYFGNAGMVGHITMKVGELLDGGLGNGAWEMNKVISMQSQDYIVESKTESWLKSPILLTPGVVSSGDALVISNSPRFDIYGNDFGWGNPIAVRTGLANKTSGKVSVLAGAEEGSVDVEVCLPCEILEAIGNDPEFIDI